MGASVEWLLSQAPFGERMLDSWEALLALLLGKPSVEVAVTHIL